MADISISHDHGMSLEDAKSKTEQIVTDVKDQFPSLVDSIDWNDDRTQADLKGKGFSGVFRVDETAMSIAIKLKLFAKPFKGKVQEKIQGRITKYFG